MHVRVRVHTCMDTRVHPPCPLPTYLHLYVLSLHSHSRRTCARGGGKGAALLGGGFAFAGGGVGGGVFSADHHPVFFWGGEVDTLIIVLLLGLLIRVVW